MTLIERRLLKLEKEMEYQKKEGMSKISELVAVKLGDSIEKYVPKLVTMSEEIESLKAQFA